MDDDGSELELLTVTMTHDGSDLVFEVNINPWAAMLSATEMTVLLTSAGEELSNTIEHFLAESRKETKPVLRLIRGDDDDR